MPQTIVFPANFGKLGQKGNTGGIYYRLSIFSLFPHLQEYQGRKTMPVGFYGRLGILSLFPLLQECQGRKAMPVGFYDRLGILSRFPHPQEYQGEKAIPVGFMGVLASSAVSRIFKKIRAKKQYRWGLWASQSPQPDLRPL
jgi:hypothetical protein